MRTRILSLSLLLAGLALGQVTPEMADTMAFFAATHQVTLAGTTTAFTLQSPVKAGKRVYPQYIVLTCSAACSVTQDRNGTAATGTAVSAVPLNTDASPVAKLYQSSDAGAGTALLPFSLQAGDAGRAYPVDMRYTVFARGSDAVQNHNWRVTSTTGSTVLVCAVWGEK